MVTVLFSRYVGIEYEFVYYWTLKSMGRKTLFSQETCSVSNSSNVSLHNEVENFVSK